jgi:hypothetical protein
VRFAWQFLALNRLNRFCRQNFPIVGKEWHTFCSINSPARKTRVFQALTTEGVEETDDAT